MKIICIGRNYQDHIRELNNSPTEEPLFFLKPDSAVLLSQHPFVIPEFSNDVHYEVEVLVKIKKSGKYIQPKFAHTYYDKIGLGIDFTARDIQKECKAKGLPWEKAKAFDGAAVIGKWIDKKELNDLENLDFSLEKNDEVVQHGNTSKMIYTIDTLIAHVSKYMTLKIGDVLFTGTPSGVGPVAIDDRLKGFLSGRPMFAINIK